MTATTVSLLTPSAAVGGLAVIMPIVTLLLTRRRGHEVRGRLGLQNPSLRALSAVFAALAMAGALVGLAAAQPIVQKTSTQRVRTDVEVFVVIDVSRSMLASRSDGSRTRLERAKRAAGALRESLPGVPMGIASLTDRVLPHLFPSVDEDVFAATLDRAVGIEHPPPRSSVLTHATDLNALASIRGLRFFKPSSTRRLVVVLTDGESLPVANARLGGIYRRDPQIALVFMHFWHDDERVFTRGAPEPQYLPQPARPILDRLGSSTGGRVYGEEVAPAIAAAREALGDGPTEVRGRQTGQTALAPYLALAAFVPVGLLLWRRDR